MAFHSSGPRELNSSPTAENKLLFTAFATCKQNTLKSVLMFVCFFYVYCYLIWQNSEFSKSGFTDPVETRFSAELMGSCRAEVIVWSEGLVERGDEVE